MKTPKNDKQKYIAFLRGINVGGHHKVLMVDLRIEIEKLGFENVETLLNSGNVIFDGINKEVEKLENIISNHLEKSFGFPIPTIIRKSEILSEWLSNNPFMNIDISKDTRLYVSLLKKETQTKIDIPSVSSDNSFKIIDKIDKTIFSVLDLSLAKTPKAMAILEQNFGKDITTRNWNTIERIGKKL